MVVVMMLVVGVLTARARGVALSNCARYSGRDAHTAITVSHECESVVVSVRDDGVGVSPDDLDQLTTRFFRAAQATAGGSGLPIATTMAAQYGGLFFVDEPTRSVWTPPPAFRLRSRRTLRPDERLKVR